MKYVLALIVGMVATLAVGMPAEAASVRGVTLQTSSANRTSGAVAVTGKVFGNARSVRIEQRKAGRWVVVRKARIVRGTYKVSLKVGAGTRLRAKVAGRVSRTVVIALKAPVKMPVKVPAKAPVKVPVKVPPTIVTDACGTVLKKADGTPWTCTFDDDFDGTTLNRALWTPQTVFATGVQAAHACYLDDPSTVSVSGGNLNLTVRKVAEPVTCSFAGLTGPTSYVAGSVMTHQKFSQQYGRFEARIKSAVSPFKGLQEAFWLWPDDRVASTTVWPVAGEIDIAENYSSYPNLAIPFLHYSADAFGAVPGLNTAWNCAAQRGAWNTYTLEWTASQLQILVNGRSCLVNRTADPAFAKPYIMALTSLMGATGNEYDGRAPLPATMQVDYVKVWK